MENYNYISNDGVFTQNQTKNEAKIKTENGVDMVEKSEEIQNSIGSKNELNELEEAKVMLDNQHLTYAEVIKKTIIDANPSSPKTRSDDWPNLREISHEILQGIKVMIIMRGPPGCGKSYLAKEIVDATTCDEHYNHIFSSDDFFYDQQGSYHFLAHRLREVHDNNYRKRVDYYARNGWSPIIVDNRNIKVWEMENYFKIAVQYGYLVHIVEPNTTWSKWLDTLVIKNSHGVPIESIERMLIDYEPTTVASVMERFGLNYAMSLPQYRQFPAINVTASMNREPKKPLMWHKHRKNCKNENESFAQIRQIYSSVELEILWDLFDMCEGDGDRTMDILLIDDSRIGNYGNNLDRAADLARNDFECDCDQKEPSSHIDNIDEEISQPTVASANHHMPTCE